MDYYLITTTHVTFKQFLQPVASELLKQGYRVTILCNLENTVQRYDSEITLVNISFSRSLLKRKNLTAFNQLKMFFKDKQGIINVHTPIASAITRIAVKNYDLKVIYTAHGYHFHNDSSRLSWILYYPVERFLSKYADKIITINQQDYEVSVNKFKAKSVAFIPGIGYQSKPSNQSGPRVDGIREELKVPLSKVIILSLGELNRNKNHQLILNYMIQGTSNQEVHYIICGIGPLETKMKDFCLKNQLLDRVHFLGYRNDVSDIMRSVNIFAFPSLREGLPVSLMESIDQELDVIAYNIRGNQDLIPEEFHERFLVNPFNVDDFYALLTDKINMWESGLGDSTKSEWVQKNQLSVILPKYLELITKL